MADFLIVIPARLASSRLPNKPLADIAGKPMIVRVAEQAAKTRARIVVASDDQSIHDVVVQAGFESVLTRVDHPSGTDRLAEVVELLGLDDDTIIVNVQGDEPLIEPALIVAAAQTLIDHPECAIATVAHPIHTIADFLNPNIVKVTLDAQGRALTFSRAPQPWPRDAFMGGLLQLDANQPLPVALHEMALRHVGLYAYRTRFLKTYPKLAVAPIEKIEALEQMRALWHGYEIAVHISHAASQAGVDTAEDLARVRLFYDNSASCK